MMRADVPSAAPDPPGLTGKPAPTPLPTTVQSAGVKFRTPKCRRTLRSHCVRWDQMHVQRTYVSTKRRPLPTAGAPARTAPAAIDHYPSRTTERKTSPHRIRPLAAHPCAGSRAAHHRERPRRNRYSEDHRLRAPEPSTSARATTMNRQLHGTSCGGRKHDQCPRLFRQGVPAYPSLAQPRYGHRKTQVRWSSRGMPLHC